MRQYNFMMVMAMILLPLLSVAEIFEPVKWSISLDSLADGRMELVAAGRIDPGWHVYSDDINPDAGPVPLTITYNDGVVADSAIRSDVDAHSEYDPMFEAMLSWWSGAVTLRQTITAEAGTPVVGTLRYGACNDENCLPPVSVPFSFGKSPAEPMEIPQPVSDSGISPLWSPVVAESNGGDDGNANADVWYIFIACFVGGFVALFTPCVWPMIPLTVSFFLKKGVNRRKSIGDALTYGLSIIVIYVALGLVVTAFFGADTLNAIATGAVCNIVFFILLVVFAVSFFGAFEIRLPSKWADRMDSSAEKTSGLLSIFFMAFTLAIVSFSCTGPIIGTLLVEAASTGSKLGPAVGMFGFSLALAIPFAVFALFPSWLKSMPRSGGWMNTVKVVLGFLELALSLKFLSVADLAYGWHILDREVFLSLWIAIFALLGLYLLGKFSFSHYESERSDGISTGRFFLAMASLAFTVYLLPGLWGAPLKGVSAFLPPLYTQDFNLGGSHVEVYDDYELGMAAAARDGKPVFIDFSGYGCVNCRKMESAVLDDDNIRKLIDNNFVVITLMVDSRRPLPTPQTVVENGRELKLTTYGERWSYLQRYKFHANAQPYYVVVSPDGRLLSGPVAYDENVDRFERFLERGLEEFAK